MNKVLLALVLTFGLSIPTSNANNERPLCELTKMLFADNFIKEKKMPAFILFTEKSCIPCQMAKPIIARIKKKFKGKIHFYTISGEEDRSNYWYGDCFGVYRIPTAYLYVVPVLETGQIITPSILLNERLLTKILEEAISLTP